MRIGKGFAVGAVVVASGVAVLATTGVARADPVRSQVARCVPIAEWDSSGGVGNWLSTRCASEPDSLPGTAAHATSHSHGALAGDIALVLTRIDSNAEVVLEPTRVGAVTSVWEGYMEARTDPRSGKTLIVSPSSRGVILSGHTREGAPLSGTGSEGYVAVQATGATSHYTGYDPAVALSDDSMMTVWTAVDVTYFQMLDEWMAPRGDAVEAGPMSWKTAASHDGSWWLMAVEADEDRVAGVHAIQLDADGALRRQPLITAELGCSSNEDSCAYPSSPLQVSHLVAESRDDRLWFGFLDSSGYNNGGYDPDEVVLSAEPYRVVRVKGGCLYKVQRDLYLESKGR